MIDVDRPTNWPDFFLLLIARLMAFGVMLVGLYYFLHLVRWMWNN